MNPMASGALDTTAALNAVEADKAARGENLASLNKMLQWSTANSSTTTNGKSEAVDEKTFKEKVNDREWMEQLFPDMFGPVKALVAVLNDSNTSAEKKVEVLEALEDYMQDMNYAVNVDKLGALDPVLALARDEGNEDVRVNALWVLGTCLQDLEEVKKTFVEKDGCTVLVDGLKCSECARVRAKAVMATSALLRNTSNNIRKRYFEIDGSKSKFLDCLFDENGNVQRRALFFLENCATNGNSWFAQEVFQDQSTFERLTQELESVDVRDATSLLEPLIGSFTGLADVNLSTVKQSSASKSLQSIASRLDETQSHTKQLIDVLNMRLSAVP